MSAVWGFDSTLTVGQVLRQPSTGRQASAPGEGVPGAAMMPSFRGVVPMTCPYRRRLGDSWWRLMWADGTEEAFVRATEVWNDLHALEAQRRSVAAGLARACGGGRN